MMDAYAPLATEPRSIDDVATTTRATPLTSAPILDHVDGGGARVPPPTLKAMGISVDGRPFDAEEEHFATEVTGVSATAAEATLPTFEEADAPSELAATPLQESDAAGGGVRVPPPVLQQVQLLQHEPSEVDSASSLSAQGKGRHAQVLRLPEPDIPPSATNLLSSIFGDPSVNEDVPPTSASHAEAAAEQQREDAAIIIQSHARGNSSRDDGAEWMYSIGVAAVTAYATVRLSSAPKTMAERLKAQSQPMPVPAPSSQRRKSTAGIGGILHASPVVEGWDGGGGLRLSAPELTSITQSSKASVSVGGGDAMSALHERANADAAMRQKHAIKLPEPDPLPRASTGPPMAATSEPSSSSKPMPTSALVFSRLLGKRLSSRRVPSGLVSKKSVGLVTRQPTQPLAAPPSANARSPKARVKSEATVLQDVPIAAGFEGGGGLRVIAAALPTMTATGVEGQFFGEEADDGIASMRDRATTDRQTARQHDFKLPAADSPAPAGSPRDPSASGFLDSIGVKARDAPAAAATHDHDLDMASGALVFARRLRKRATFSMRNVFSGSSSTSSSAGSTSTDNASQPPAQGALREGIKVLSDMPLVEGFRGGGGVRLSLAALPAATGTTPPPSPPYIDPSPPPSPPGVTWAEDNPPTIEEPAHANWRDAPMLPASTSALTLHGSKTERSDWDELEMPLPVRLTLMGELRRRKLLGTNDTDWRPTVRFASELKERYARVVRRESSWGLLLGYTKRPKLQALLAFQRLGASRAAFLPGAPPAATLPAPGAETTAGNEPAVPMDEKEDRAAVWERLALAVKGVDAGATTLPMALLYRPLLQQQQVVSSEHDDLLQTHDAIDIDWLPDVPDWIVGMPAAKDAKKLVAVEKGDADIKVVDQRPKGKCASQKVTPIVNLAGSPASAVARMVTFASVSPPPAPAVVAAPPSPLNSGLRRKPRAAAKNMKKILKVARVAPGIGDEAA